MVWLRQPMQDLNHQQYALLGSRYALNFESDSGNFQLSWLPCLVLLPKVVFVPP